jgi:hypothetical protein
MQIPFKLPRFQGGPKIFVAFFCTFLLILLVQRSPVAAQSSPINRATITEVLDSPQVFIQSKQAKVKDSANKGQRVRTAEARAQLQFNTGAVGRLAHNSVLTVGQCARLRQGTLLVNGAMNGCTSSVIAGVRGTTYLLEVDEAGESRIKVLEGKVTVTRSAPLTIDDEEPTDASGAGIKQFRPSIGPGLPTSPIPTPAQPDSSTSISQPVTPSALPANPTPARNPNLPDPSLRSNDSILKVEAPQSTNKRPVLQVETAQTNAADEIVLAAGEKISVSPTGKLGLVEKLTQADFTSILRGSLFDGFTTSLPGISKIQQSFQSLFPGVPFPLRLPGIPSIPTPPVRLPFPF